MNTRRTSKRKIASKQLSKDEEDEQTKVSSTGISLKKRPRSSKNTTKKQKEHCEKDQADSENQKSIFDEPVVSSITKPDDSSLVSSSKENETSQTNPSSINEGGEESEEDEDLPRRTKHKEGSRILDSDEESSGSSEGFINDHFSLDDLEDFKPVSSLKNKIDTIESDENSKKDASLPPESKEYYDFSSIMKNQEELKLLETKINHFKEKHDNSKLISEDESNDELDVSELLQKCEKHKTKKPTPKKRVSEEKEIPSSSETKTVEITIKPPEIHCRRQDKVQKYIEATLKRHLNEEKRKFQLLLHKVHTLCLIAHGLFINYLVNDQELLAVAMSLLPSNKFYPPESATISYIQNLLKWFHKQIAIDKELKSDIILFESLKDQYEHRVTNSYKNFTLLFVCLTRALGLNSRLVISLQPVPLKPSSSEIKKVSQTNEKKSEESDKDNDSDEEDDLFEEVDITKKSSTTKQKSNPKQSSSNGKSSKNETKSGGSTSKAKGKTNKKKDAKKNKSEICEKGNSTRKKITKTDKPELPEKSNPKNRKVAVKDKAEKATTSKSPKQIDRRVLPSDEDLVNKSKISKSKLGIDVWAEIFIEQERRWVSVDVARNDVDCVSKISVGCTRPLRYVIAWDNTNCMKDVTRRYAPQWLTATQKLRVDAQWWNEALSPWSPNDTKMEREENKELQNITEETPLPKTLSEYKGHPHYALKRHLLKFEAIYPPEAVPLGFFKNEPVYSRVCVTELHTRETWMRQGKVVRLKEEPYKIVKARPKYDKMSGKVIKDLPLHLFGYWQVEEYMAPPAVDGKVPRNEYGNVELYKPSMLPPGTVHLQIPGVMRLARKLDIDCANAVVGWEFHSGGSHPVIDGVVICEEFKDTLLDAWNKEIDDSAKRSKEKTRKRAIANWKKLIRGVIVRHRLKRKYNFQFDSGRS